MSADKKERKVPLIAKEKPQTKQKQIYMKQINLHWSAFIVNCLLKLTPNWYVVYSIKRSHDNTEQWESLQVTHLLWQK